MSLGGIRKDLGTEAGARMQEQMAVRKLYAGRVDEDDQADLRLENQRLRDRVEVLEGMFRSLSIGVGGSINAMLEWMESTRLPPPERD